MKQMSRIATFNVKNVLTLQVYVSDIRDEAALQDF